MSLWNRLSSAMWVGSALVLAGVLIWLSLHANAMNESNVTFSHSHLKIVRSDGSTASFNVEVAITPAQQEHGLMFRKSLDPDAGMIFVWPADQPISMWMKDTFIPLDMLYLAHDGQIVKVVANAVPHDLTPLVSGMPVRAVIEIGGGEAAKQNIKTGDKVVFQGLTGTP